MTQNLSLTLPIEGMTCASCSARVERALQRVPGVQQVSVNLASESAAVELAAPVGAEALAQAVEKAGYAVPREQVELRIDGMTCATCVARVEKALRSVPGVLEAGVNLATSTAQVTRLAGATPTPALQQAVQRAGYEATASDSDTPTPPRPRHDPGWKVALAFALSAPLPRGVSCAAAECGCAMINVRRAALPASARPDVLNRMVTSSFAVPRCGATGDGRKVPLPCNGMVSSV